MRSKADETLVIVETFDGAHVQLIFLIVLCEVAVK